MDRYFDETFSTTDPALAEALVAESYSQNSTRYVGSTDRFFFRYGFSDLGKFGVARFGHTVECFVDMQPLEDVITVSRAHAGQLNFTDRRRTLSARSSSAMFNPDEETRVLMDDCVVTMLRLERPAVERLAAELTAYEGSRPFRFEMANPVSEAKSRHWDALVGYVVRDLLPNRAVRDNPMISTQVVRLLVTCLLDTFPIATAEPSRGPGAAGVGVVRRALAFMAEHASSDISVHDIATAARVGPRSPESIPVTPEHDTLGPSTPDPSRASSRRIARYGAVRRCLGGWNRRTVGFRSSWQVRKPLQAPLRAAPESNAPRLAQMHQR